MIDSAPKRKGMILLIFLSSMSISYAQKSFAPFGRIGYLATSSSTAYGSTLNPESNVAYSTNGIEIEAGILHKWFSINGTYLYSQRNTFPEKGSNHSLEKAPGKPIITGGGISTYFERLNLPLKNADVILKICPGLMVGYWVDKKSKWNRTIAEYEDIVETRHFAGLLRFDGGYGMISGYGKIGIYETSDLILGAGVTMILKHKK